MAKIKLSLNNYQGNAEERLEYLSSGSVFDVFPDTFMETHTKHKTFVDFCEAIHCDMTSQDDLDKLQSGDFNSAIRLQSDFESWEDMAETAYQLIKKN